MCHSEASSKEITEVHRVSPHIPGLKVERQKQFPVSYKSVPIGTFIPDFIVEDLIIVDPKVVSAFNDAHIAQMLGYLAITRLSLALLLNFKHAKLEWRRAVPPSV